MFLISAMFGLGGAILTLLFLPDTTGLNLEEYDRLQRCLLEDRWDDYHGEAVNPRHLSLFERLVLGWGRNYDPEQDQKDLRVEAQSFMQHAVDPTNPSMDGVHQLLRNPIVQSALQEEFGRMSDMALRSPSSVRQAAQSMTHRSTSHESAGKAYQV